MSSGIPDENLSAPMNPELLITQPWVATAISIANQIKDPDTNIYQISFRTLARTYTMGLTYHDVRAVIKTEATNGTGEIDRNIAGYAMMPTLLRPIIFEEGSSDGVRYILMEHAGISLKTVLSNDIQPQTIESLYEALNSSYQATDTIDSGKVLQSWNNLLSPDSQGFSFATMLNRINAKHGIDTSHAINLLQGIYSKVIEQGLLPQHAFWSLGDLTASHLFYNGNHWITIDPKEFAYGIPEIDLGRLCAQILMFTDEWKETFNDTTEMENPITHTNASDITERLRSLALSLRQHTEPDINSLFFFKLGMVWQYIVAIQAREGQKILDLYQEAEHILEEIYA